MDKEKFTINCFKNHHIGDDCAILDGRAFSRQSVWCKDLFVENSHFKRGWLTPREIGSKAVLVNISDIISMNAKPKFALVGLGFPRDTKLSFIKELTRGINETCAKFGCEVVGGDTISSKLIFLSISIVGNTREKALKRSGVKNGDLIGFSGKLGGSLKALRALSRGGVVGSKSRFKNPVLRDKFVYKSAKFMRCAMDISDGLSSDLAKFVPNFALKFEKRLSKFELNSGEEYEVMFACSAKNRHKIALMAKKSRTKVTFFAKTKRGKYKKYGKNEHF